MDKYAIYNYEPKLVAMERDWTIGEQDGAVGLKDAQTVLERLFGETTAEFRVQKNGRDGADRYPCTVLAHDDHVVLLRLENEKKVPYYEKSRPRPDQVARIEKREQPSFPNCYILLDFRPGRNMIAIQVDRDAWRSTDVVRNLLQESINLNLESLSAGLAVEVKSKMQTLEFWDYSRQRIKTHKRSVKKMTIYFDTGKISPQAEAIVKRSPYLKRLLKELWGGKSGEVTINDPIGDRIIDRRKHDIENIVTLITSDMVGKNFGLRLTFDDNISYTCGKGVRAELPMDSEDYLAKFQMKSKNLMDEYDIEYWLDQAVELTKDFSDEETVTAKPDAKAKKQIA
ncbi:MAG: hypothetical protein IJ544_09495 [Prevotella sp.]|nr:hypothetical protein [Prevotella sp.]